MLRIAVESVRDDDVWDARGASASRGVHPAHRFPLRFPSYHSARSFAPDASSFSAVGRTCCSYRSFAGTARSPRRRVGEAAGRSKTSQGEKGEDGREEIALMRA